MTPDPRLNETLLEKCARLKRELQAKAKPPYSNDNADLRERERMATYWWQRD